MKKKNPEGFSMKKMMKNGHKFAYFENIFLPNI